MALGSPQTTKFSIGTAELRVGPLTLANKLTQAYSVGLIDSVSVTVEQEAAELEGGFPRKLVDTAIIRQTATVTATLREYSRRNLRLLLGEGVDGSSPTSVSTTIAASEAAGQTTISLTSASLMAVGDFLTIYPTGEPEKVTVGRIASIATNDVTLDEGTLYAYDAGTPVYISRQIAIGNVSKTNYFSVMVIQKENSTGKPLVWSFWKGALAAGLTLETNAEDFASTELQINLLEPAASEYASGGDLLHVAEMISAGHPIGYYAGGAD